VSESVPDRPRANFAAALNVRQNAIRGFAFALLMTAAVLALFVFLPGTRQPTPYYLGLGFVLLTTLGALATTVLTLVSAYRLAKEEGLQDGPRLDERQ
jgi:Na+/pantothenate symporter